MKFLKSENGSVTVEAVLWMSFLFAVGVTVANTLGSSLVDHAVAQKQLNLESIQLIETLGTCGGEAL